MSAIDEQLLEDLYAWVDKIPLSRPKRDLRRDFSDGVLIAEVIHHYLPRQIDVHNYSSANKVENKTTNWKLLNRKVFKKLGFEVNDEVIQNVVTCKPWATEQFLMMLRRRIDRYLYENHRNMQPAGPLAAQNDQPEADQNIKAPETSYASLNAKESPHYSQSTAKTGVPQSGSTYQTPMGVVIGGSPTRARDMVPKIVVEEKEQELLAKEETIQILQAKVRRLEHLLHLKDIRIDDLQGRMERMEAQMRPTARYTKK